MPACNTALQPVTPENRSRSSTLSCYAEGHDEEKDKKIDWGYNSSWEATGMRISLSTSQGYAYNLVQDAGPGAGPGAVSISADINLDMSVLGEC
jgi:hypothetical protein